MRTVIAVLSLALTFTSSAGVLLDDTWADGDRGDGNLPDESAWFGSAAGGTATLSAAPGALTGMVRLFDTNTTSRLWITHFTEPGAPAELTQAGDTLKATLIFTPSGVTTNPATSRGLRIGLFNFSEQGATRVSGDGFSTAGTAGPGANVTGYMVSLNFAQVFTINHPIEIMKRADVANANLLGTTPVFTRVGSTGGGASGNPGFRNDAVYTLELSLQLLAQSAELTATISDTSGWRISHTVTDATSPLTRFDTLAVRPNSVLDTAESFTFRQAKIEHISSAPRMTRVVINPERFSLTVHWESLPGVTYRLEAASAVDATIWEFIGSLTASGRSASLDDPNGFFEDTWFYRLRQVP